VSCSLLYTLSGAIMWSKLEDDEEFGPVVKSAIDTFLRVSGCGCSPGSWSCFGSRDEDSLYVEQSCQSCGATASILLEWPSSTASKTEGDS
jgi:hypothetical protein